MGEVGAFDEATGGFVDLEVEAGEVFIGDIGAIDLDAFVDPDEVGRGVEARAVTGGGEDASEGGGGGAFTVGSGDEDGGKGGLRVAEGSGEDTHVGEVELSSRSAGRGGSQLMAKGVKMVDRCSVGQGAILGDYLLSGCEWEQGAGWGSGWGVGMLTRRD
jgi:hypothetical protein